MIYIDCEQSLIFLEIAPAEIRTRRILKEKADCKQPMIYNTVLVYFMTEKFSNGVKNKPNDLKGALKSIYQYVGEKDITKSVA